MVKVVLSSFEHQEHDDPDSYLGEEQRIYFNDPWDGVAKLPKIIDAASTCGLHSLYVCLRLPGKYRELIYFFEPSQEIVWKLGTWQGNMMFYPKEDVKLYVSARPRFDDDEKLMLLLMKAPAGSFA